MKFMHISDVHLGAKPDAGKPWSERRRKDIWDSFAEVIDTAKKEKPDFLFITGDLFHGQPLKKEVREVNALLEEIPHTNVIIMAGNHDYLKPKSYYLSYPWGKNVFFFRKETMQVFDFPEQNTAVYGMSYWHREIKERLYDTVRPQNPERFNVLMVHGGDEAHIPFSAKRFVQAGFDYTACGHIHKGEQLQANRVVMAGALEPIDCNELGPHGYWIGEGDKRGVQVSFYPIRKCQYRHEHFYVNRDTTNRELMRWENQLLQESEPYQMLRIFLEGKADPDFEPDLERLEQNERIIDVSCDLSMDYDYEKLREEQEHTLLGRYIDAMQAGEESTVTRKALEYGVNALLGHKICR